MTDKNIKKINENLELLVKNNQNEKNDEDNNIDNNEYII